MGKEQYGDFGQVNGAVVNELMINQDRYDFYKAFYDENRLPMMQYKSLMVHFNRMVENVLGKKYYNTEVDVYNHHRVCCEDITRKSKSFFSRLFWWGQYLRSGLFACYI